MSKDLIYTIYSHSDADGGIAAYYFKNLSMINMLNTVGNRSPTR